MTEAEYSREFHSEMRARIRESMAGKTPTQLKMTRYVSLLTAEVVGDLLKVVPPAGIEPALPEGTAF
jgi:hypothetical protein